MIKLPPQQQQCFNHQYQYIQILQLPIMKRRPSQQLMHPFNNSKDIKRLRSPHKKNYINQEHQHSIPYRHKITKPKEQLKGDSNNTTATTKPRSHKTLRKNKQKRQQNLGQQQIMSLINSFAIKIQRQWKAYLLRKRLKQLIKSIRPQQKSEKSSKGICQLKFDNKKIKRLIKFQSEEEIPSVTTLYDKQKYENLSSFKSQNNNKANLNKSKSKKSVVLSKSSNSTPRNRVQKSNSTAKTPRNLPNITDQLSKSLQRPLSSRQIRDLLPQKERRASFNIFQAGKNIQNRRHSTGQLQVPLRSSSQKVFHIDKVVDIRVEQNKKKEYESPNIQRRIQSQATIAFHKGSSFQKTMRRCKKELQMTKLKQLLSIENRYNKNEVTYRSYLQVVGKINQEHCHKLHQIKLKQGQLKNTLGQLFQLYKSNHEPKFAEDDPSSNSHLDVSISFERWDFNSSAKKSIDHMQFPEGNGSKALSIQSVLKELDQQQNGVPTQRFKKNKSMQMIEAIAQRSKQVSDKSVCQFQQVPCNSIDQVNAVQTEKHNKAIITDQKSKQFIQKSLSVISQKYLSPQRQVNQGQNTNIQNQKGEVPNSSQNVKEEETPQSNSLLITPGGEPQLVGSQQSIEQNQKIMTDMIFREIKAPAINYQDPLVIKFRQMVVQSMVMVNIKIVSSLKFSFAKISQKRRQMKAASAPSINPDINAINSWLLQISHFMLDSYQQILRQNIINVKQPPISEILQMAQRQVHTNLLYQTIPEYIFKDFQFFYIKSLSKSNQIKNEDYDKFSGFTYTFHRALIDCLNTALMQQLTTGKEWIKTPWNINKKFKHVKIVPQYAKQCLQHAINVVSNWAEYGLGRLQFQQDFSEAEYRQFQQQKINLVCRQQVLQTKLSYTFNIGHIMLKLVQKQIEYEMESAALDLLKLIQ